MSTSLKVSKKATRLKRIVYLLSLRLVIESSPSNELPDIIAASYTIDVSPPLHVHAMEPMLSRHMPDSFTGYVLDHFRRRPRIARLLSIAGS